MNRIVSTSWAVLGAPFLVILGLSCGDPVHAGAVADLGPEASGVRTGPLHRPGQPCTVCHSGSGPGSPTWVVAGTVYDAAGSATPAVGARVSLVDAKGEQLTLTTNGAGNFYVREGAFGGVLPFRQVTITQDGHVDAIMKTQINGSGGCAECHRGNGNQGRVPALFLGAKQ